MEVAQPANRILTALFEARTGQQLALSRRWRVETALVPLMRERGLQSLDQLVSRIVSGSEPALREEVVEALLNNETYFFRDRTPFELLLGGPLKRLEQARAQAKRLSIWCAGCSTGQEAYSLAMGFAEEKLRWHGWRIDIVGTDISRSAVERARAGLYTQFEVQRGLAVRQMLRWFDEAGPGEWKISPELRRMVRFEPRSLTDPPPQPGRFDIVLCRNVLLYFPPERRRLTFEALSNAIAPDGLLMLGAGETVIGQTERFVAHPDHRGLYMPTPLEVAPRRARIA